MKATYLPQIKRFKIPPFFLLTIAVALIAIHLTLNIRLKKSIDIPMSIVCWLAASSVFWDKRQQLKLGSSIFSSILGTLLIAAVLFISATHPGHIKFLGFFPFISILGLALLASGITQIKQYQKELIILLTLGVPRIILPYLPDISPLTAKFSAFLLWYANFQVSLQGMHISLPNGGVQVVPACSGLNLILYMLGLSVIFLVMFSTNATNKIVAPMVAVIIGFLVNSVRVALLAVLSTHSDEHLFEYWHSKEGGLIFVVIAVALFGWFYSSFMDWTTSPETNFKSSFNPFRNIPLTMTTLQNPHERQNSANSSSKGTETHPLSLSWLQSIVLLRFVGYGLLLLTLFDLIEILYPFNFLDSAWEFAMFGQLVERVVVPLIGLVLVFYGGRDGRFNWEKRLLSILSWLSLLAAISFFVLVPLSLINTVRIDRDNSTAIDIQTGEKMTEVRQLEDTIDRVTTQAQMNTVLSYFEDLPSGISKSQQLDVTKQKVVEFVNSGKQSMLEQAAKAKSNQRQQLLKSSVKWNLGALISGVLFVLIWQGTYWTRK